MGDDRFEAGSTDYGTTVIGATHIFNAVYMVYTQAQKASVKRFERGVLPRTN